MRVDPQSWLQLVIAYHETFGGHVPKSALRDSACMFLQVLLTLNRHSDDARDALLGITGDD